MEITTLGLDLAKNVFQVHGIGSTGEVVNLAYRWFCRLGLDGDVPDHSTFSKNRHGRFRESDRRAHGR